MAITQTPLDSGADTAVGSSAVTNSFTTVDTRLTVLNVAAHPSGGPRIPTVSGWTLIEDNDYDPAATGQVCAKFGRIASGTGTHTIDFAGENQEDIVWSVSEYDGVDVSAGVANAWIQAVTAAGSGANPSVTLAAFGDVDNATIGLVSGVDGLGAITEGAGFAEIHELASGTLIRMESQWRADNDTSVTWTAAAAVWGAIGVELRDAGEPPPPEMIFTDNIILMAQACL